MAERRNQQQGRQPQQSQSGTRQPQQGQSQGSGMGQQGSMGAGQEFPQDKVRGSQQGGQSGTGQQRQFDSQGSGQQSGGSGTGSAFASQIREHMEVVDADGRHCGTVDHLEGDRIKLSRKDSPDGQHHYVPMNQVAGIEGGKVCLRSRGDNAFGMEAGR
jgi:hypothetical protein